MWFYILETVETPQFDESVSSLILNENLKTVSSENISNLLDENLTQHLDRIKQLLWCAMLILLFMVFLFQIFNLIFSSTFSKEPAGKIAETDNVPTEKEISDFSVSVGFINV